MRGSLAMITLVLAACGGEAEANPIARPPATFRPLRVRVSPPPPPLSQTAAAVVAANASSLTRPTEHAVTPSVPSPDPLASDGGATIAPSADDVASATSAPDGQPAESPPPGAPAATAAGELPANPVPVPPAIARAHELVSAWLVAQNEGRFDDYAALYADGFQGVKRSAARVRRFDRGGWLTDRRGMFSVPMHVQARDIEVQPGPEGTVVRFTQVFRAARYHDEGPKELTLVERDGRLAILREEMLQSRTGNTGRPAAELSPGTFMLAVHHGNATWLVLSRAVEPSWSQGDATLVERGRLVVTKRAAVPGALPSELAALVNADVRLFGPRADVCTGRIAELTVMRRADVHPSTERIWAEDRADPAAAEARIAASAWDLGVDGTMLVARIDGPAACGAASWGRLSALPAPPLLVPIPPPPHIAEGALTAFRMLPSYRALQRQYTTAANAPAERPWEQHGATRPTVTMWSDANTQWVSVTQSVALGGCDQWRGRLWALFEVEENGLALRTDVTNPGYHVPIAAVDADGDGSPDFVTAEGLVRRRGGVHQIVETLAYARHERGCD